VHLLQSNPLLLAGKQLLCVHAALSTYYERFKALLSPSNAMQVQLLMRLASALYSCISGPDHKAGQQQQQQQVGLRASIEAAGAVSAFI
jgi:hypothetical protein